MTKTLVGLLLLLLAVGCGGDYSDNSKTINRDKADNKNGTKPEEKDRQKLSASTPEEFSRSVLALLAANDSDRFIDFVFPSKEELFLLIQETLPAGEQARARKEVNEGLAEKRESILKSFVEVRKRAALAGCSLEAASFGHCNSDVPPIKGDIDVIITESGKSYQFEIDDCLLANGRWYNMDGLKWRGDHGQWHRENTPILLPPPEDPDEMDLPWITAGIIEPQTEPADTEKIQPNEKVIGVVLEGKARAYLLDAFDNVERTVVNDVIDGTPVSITYYPMKSVDDEPEKRVRVFVDGYANKALVMGLAGTKNGQMRIYCQSKQYFQMGSKIPVWHDANQDGKQDKGEVHYLVDLAFKVMNWDDWKKAHPKTDVYLGKGRKGETPRNL